MFSSCYSIKDVISVNWLFYYSGPVLALGLARNDAISEWRKLLGPPTVSEAKEQAPESLRAQFSIGESFIKFIF